MTSGLRVPVLVPLGDAGVPVLVLVALPGAVAPPPVGEELLDAPVAAADEDAIGA